MLNKKLRKIVALVVLGSFLMGLVPVEGLPVGGA